MNKTEWIINIIIVSSCILMFIPYFQNKDKKYLLIPILMCCAFLGFGVGVLIGLK